MFNVQLSAYSISEVDLKDFRKLIVWEKSHSLALEIYRITNKFPKDEIYGITNQLRRACTSIPTNIAEGCGRDSSKDFARFLQIAFGSANEMEYLILLSSDLKYIESEIYQNLTDNIIEIKKMLSALIKKLRAES